MYIGETSSSRLRAFTAAWAYAVSCVFGIVMNTLTPYMLQVNAWNWGLKTAWFYVGLGIFPATAVWFVMPETKR